MPHIRMTPDGRPTRNDREGAMTWTKGALDVIARDGVDAVKISRLAKEVGVSKGSFYWFFEDLHDLLGCCLEHWKSDLNEVVFEAVARLDGPPIGRMHFLVETVFDSKLGRYDAAIRSWALKDINARSVVQEVDKRRLEFLTALFLQAGLPDDLSRMRAHLLYRAIIAESYLSEYPGEVSGVGFLKILISEFLEDCTQNPASDRAGMTNPNMGGAKVGG